MFFPNLTVSFTSTETLPALFTSVPQGLEQRLVHGVGSERSLTRALSPGSHLPQVCLGFTSILLKIRDTA